MCWKRRVNLALARRSASSGSTFSLRARLAITNRMSPISSVDAPPASPLAARFVQLGQLLVELLQHLLGARPIEIDPRGALGELLGAHQRGQGHRHVVEQRRRMLGRALLGLQRLPGFGLLLGRALDLRQRTRADGARSSCRRAHCATSAKSNAPCSSAMRAWNATWNRRSPSSSLSAAHVVALDRVGDFVGFLDRVRRDGREGLLDIPRAAAFAVPQPRHHVEHGLGGGGIAGEGRGALFFSLISSLAPPYSSRIR